MPQLTEAQQSVVVAALASLVGKPASEIETIVTGDEPNQVESLVNARIKSIRDEGDKAGRGKLQKEANKLVKQLFNLNDVEPESISDLLTAIKEGYKPTVDPSLLTEEQVKKHQAFRDLEKKLQDQTKEHEKALSAKDKEKDAEIQYLKIESQAIDALSKFGAVVSEDAKLETVRRKLYLEELKGIRQDENGHLWKTDKDGNEKRIENDKLFPLTLDDYLKGHVESHYTTKVSPPRTAPGVSPTAPQVGQPSGGGFKHFKGTLPKDQNELNTILMDYRNHSVDARDEVETWWNQQQQQ